MNGDETGTIQSGTHHGRDASLEEVLHLITQFGYANAYPCSQYIPTCLVSSKIRWYRKTRMERYMRTYMKKQRKKHKK